MRQLGGPRDSPWGLVTTPVNQHAVPALRPCSVNVSCVCVSRARVHACVISIVSPPMSTDAVEAATCMRSNLIRYLSKLNPKLNCQEPKLDSQLRVSANKAVAPSSWVHWFLCQLFAHGKKTPSGRCRRRATGRRVCSGSRPGCRRSAPRLRRPSTTLSLLQSPNWRLSEPHLASSSTHSRGPRLSGPTLRIAGSRSVLAVASELNN